MIVRRAKLSDIPEIIRLGERLTRDGEWKFTSINFASAVERLRHAVSSPRQWVGIVEHHGRIVGFMILVAHQMWWNPKQWMVSDDIFYCDRPGSGRMLLRLAMKWVDALPFDVADVIFSFNAGIDTERVVKTMEKYGLRQRGVTMSVPREKLRSRNKWAA